jgi:hypothetical protein
MKTKEESNLTGQLNKKNQQTNFKQGSFEAEQFGKPVNRHQDCQLQTLDAIHDDKLMHLHACTKIVANA